MNILLVNTNPVVSRLISLCVRDEDTVFEEVTDVNTVNFDRYDIVFVDDASYVDGLEDILTNLMVRKKVFLSAKDFHKDNLDTFDEVIQKPFLPSQITALLEDLGETENEIKEIKDEHFIFPLSTESNTIEDEIEEEKIELEESKKATVLDGNEINKIKALLEADGLEIVNEDEYVNTLSKKSKKKKKKKEETFTFEEALIAAVEGMKVKKIKKLLKGADVTIKISFKDQK